MLATLRQCSRTRPLLRLYSSEPTKPSVKLIAELRKVTPVSLTKAREALAATNNNLDEALTWLNNDRAATGAQKLAKLGGRATAEGVIGVCVASKGAGANMPEPSGVRAAMIELNCETDFVARNDIFATLADNIAATTAFLSEHIPSQSTLTPYDLDALQDAPLMTSSADPTMTVGSAIRDAVVSLGENITLRRAVTVVQPPAVPLRSTSGFRLGSYVHGSVNNRSQGRVGALALLALKSPRMPELLSSDAFRTDVEKLERSIARQIVGFETTGIDAPAGTTDETALYQQPFMMLGEEAGNRSVKDVLQSWARLRGMVKDDDASDDVGLEVVDFAKWTVGESLTPSSEP